ncbi:MAG TPA: hypothetical protein VFL86_24145 [Burkholderiaceae bacterium]|nr:hypothetical protein [Burkholderiaceae bacterium]
MAASNATAAIYCDGKISAVYKWADMQRLSIRIKSDAGVDTEWINMPTKSDEAMALLAIASGKPISLYWASSDVTTCLKGWVNNRTLEGFFVVTN